MSAFATTALLSFLLYLFLTTASGSALVWSTNELLFGAVFALLVAGMTRHILRDRWSQMLNPRRLLLFVFYLFGPFFVALAKANFDVVYRVITGRIKPGIVRISPGLKTDAGITFLANSITLTPGTLSVDIDETTNDLYVHWINVDERVLTTIPRDCRPICGEFPVWARRIAE
jgi:multicomponent Na+:H+ antiporter subunit E